MSRTPFPRNTKYDAYWSESTRPSVFGRYVRDARTEADIESANYRDIMARRHVPSRLRAVKLLAKTQPYKLREGKEVPWYDWGDWLRLEAIKGGGAYGLAFSLAYGGRVQQALEEILDQGSAKVFAKRPAPGQTVVVKISQDSSRDPGVISQDGADVRRVLGLNDEFKQSCVREAVLHRYLDGAGCVTLRGTRNAVCVDRVVPDFFWSAMVVDLMSGRRHYVTVMSQAPGAPVRGMRQRYSAQVFLAVERAIASLWIHGVVHADFHDQNMFYDAASGRVTVIDFGFGLRLPAAVSARIRETIPGAIAAGVSTLGELWQPASRSKFGLDIQAYANRVQATRTGLKTVWYNPESRALRVLYAMLPDAERARVPALRQDLWGRPPAPTTPPPQLPPLRVCSGMRRFSQACRDAAARMRRSPSAVVAGPGGSTTTANSTPMAWSPVRRSPSLPAGTPMAWSPYGGGLRQQSQPQRVAFVKDLLHRVGVRGGVAKVRDVARRRCAEIGKRFDQRTQQCVA